jgi:hypothetical protein
MQYPTTSPGLASEPDASGFISDNARHLVNWNLTRPFRP